MGNVIGRYTWDEVFAAEDAETKVQNFHKTLRHFLDKFFPEKSLKISKFDKNGFLHNLEPCIEKSRENIIKIERV